MKKYLNIVTAALFATSPIVGVSYGISQATVVHAATVLSMEQLNKPYYEAATKEKPDYEQIKLTKKKPYLTAYNEETVKKFAKQRLTDVTPNLGSIKSWGNINVYPTLDNGEPDFDHVLSANTKLKAGNNYVAVINAEVKYVSSDPERVEVPIFQTLTSMPENNWYSNGFWSDSYSDFVGLLVPVRVNGKAPASVKKVNKRGYVKVHKNKKVRTYTSTGKFTKKYVYGHKTYKLNRKKSIKGHGTCYKIYGKNQWIPAKYLKVK